MRLKELDLNPLLKKLLEIKGINKLYPPQQQAIKKGVLNGKNILMATQTASGKTLLAEIIAVNNVMKGRGKTVYLTPLKALAGEKYEDFKKYEAIGIKTAITVGNYDSADPFLEHYDIIITTYEKMDSLLRHKPRWHGKVSLVIIDEIHYIDDPKRGPVLESLIAKLKTHRTDTQLIALSATIGNPEEIASWLDASPVVSEWRPVKLKEGVYYRGIIKYKDGTSKSVTPFYSHPTFDLIMDSVKEGGQALVFVNSRRRAVSLAEAAAKKMNLPKDPRRTEVATKLLNTSDVPLLNKKLHDLVKKGVCFHHAGLNYQQRRIIEEAFRNGVLKAIFATPTLAAGVNLPARRVIIEDYQRYSVGEGSKPIKILEYKQFAGRAGRPGYDEYGDAIIISKTGIDLDFIVYYYLKGQPEDIKSKMGSLAALRKHVLAYIAMNSPTSPEKVLKFLKNTLYSYQGGKRSTPGLLLKVLSFLEENDFIMNETSSLTASLLGRKVSEVYIDPLTALYFIRGLNKGRKPTPFSILHLITASPDMPILSIKKKEIVKLERAFDERSPEILIGLEDREDPGYEDLLSEIKTAMFLEDWINEVPEQTISEKYDLGPGDIRAYVETAEWIAYSFYKISESMSELANYTQFLKEMEYRIKNGVKKELIELTKIPNIGRVRARKLYRAGYRKIEDLKKASISSLTRIEGIGKELATSIIEYVNKLEEPLPENLE